MNLNFFKMVGNIFFNKHYALKIADNFLNRIINKFFEAVIRGTLMITLRIIGKSF